MAYILETVYFALEAHELNLVPPVSGRYHRDFPVGARRGVGALK